jgi:hypothetical protein
MQKNSKALVELLYYIAFMCDIAKLQAQESGAPKN